MSIALYRKYRPKTFEKVLGQDSVISVLKNQVKYNNISHAYLFSGERGCGKTTCAKIFAKAINCLNPIDGSPCNECINCRTIDQESSLDFIEMDAASNRGIEDIRNIKDNCIYPPQTLKYKVYIIDEAHMITKEGLNALLKIMEEPPDYLVFILATTEKDQLMPTILSRLQQFDFNKIKHQDILKQIDIVLEDYDITMEPEAKDIVIEKANGAIRDALSILDRIISTGEKYYSVGFVTNLLGIVRFNEIFTLVSLIHDDKKEKALECLLKIKAESGKSNINILEQLIDFYRHILFLKTGMADTSNQDNYKEQLEIFSQNCDLNRISDSLEILSEYKNRLKLSENDDIIPILAVMRLLNYVDYDNLNSRIEKLEREIKSLKENRCTDNYHGINENFDRSVKQKEISKDKPREEPKIDVRSAIDSFNIFHTAKIDDIKNVDKLEIYNRIIRRLGSMYSTFFNEDSINFKGNIVEITVEDKFIGEMFKEKTVKIIEEIIKDFTKSDIIVKIVLKKCKEPKIEKKAKSDLNSDKNEIFERLKTIFGNELELR